MTSNKPFPEFKTTRDEPDIEDLIYRLLRNVKLVRYIERSRQSQARSGRGQVDRAMECLRASLSPVTKTLYTCKCSLGLSKADLQKKLFGSVASRNGLLECKQ